MLVIDLETLDQAMPEANPPGYFSHVSLARVNWILFSCSGIGSESYILGVFSSDGFPLLVFRLLLRNQQRIL